jgi:hypothetical protein
MLFSGLLGDPVIINVISALWALIPNVAVYFQGQHARREQGVWASKW